MNFRRSLDFFFFSYVEKEKLGREKNSHTNKPPVSLIAVVRVRDTPGVQRTQLRQRVRVRKSDPRERERERDSLPADEERTS